VLTLSANALAIDGAGSHSTATASRGLQMAAHIGKPPSGLRAGPLSSDPGRFSLAPHRVLSSVSMRSAPTGC